MATPDTDVSIEAFKSRLEEIAAKLPTDDPRIHTIDVYASENPFLDDAQLMEATPHQLKVLDLLEGRKLTVDGNGICLPMRKSTAYRRVSFDVFYLHYIMFEVWGEDLVQIALETYLAALRAIADSLG